MKRLIFLMMIFFPIHSQEYDPVEEGEIWGWHTDVALEECDADNIMALFCYDIFDHDKIV